jgi:integrase
MIRNIGSLSYYVRYVQTVDFPEREFPLVYFSDGTMSYVLMLFIKHLYTNNLGKPHALSTLYLVCGEIHEFYMSASESELIDWDRNPSLMIVEYQNSRINGTIKNFECKRDLWWTPLAKDIVKKRLLAFLKLENFTKLYLNTVDFKLGDYLGVFTKNFADQDFDLLAHLDAKQEEDKEKSFAQNYQQFNSDYTGDAPVSTITKFFPPKKIMEFIDEEKNINYKAIFLLCAFSGLRESEPLHIFRNDLLPMQQGYQVLFSHPLKDDTVDVETGELINREKYLKSYHNQLFKHKGLDKEEIAYLEKPVPRVGLVGTIERFDLAFKGVTLKTSIEYGDYAGLYTLEWTLQAAEKLFISLIPALLMQKRRNHPYLFCKKNGAPMSKGSYEKHFQRRSKKLTGKALGTHTLRHFAGMFSANGLHLSKDNTQRILRHKNPDNTAIYYSIIHEKGRNELTGSTEITVWEKLLKTLDENWGKIEWI